jgi:hypothetical protein
MLLISDRVVLIDVAISFDDIYYVLHEFLLSDYIHRENS